MSNFIVDAVLAVTPRVPGDGRVAIWVDDPSGPTISLADAEPIAAAQAVAAIRALTKPYPDSSVMPMGILAALAAEIEQEYPNAR